MAKLTEEQMAALRSQQSVQDKRQPFLIHREDGALFPNVGRLRNNKNLLPYNGAPDASLDERMQFLRTGSARRVVNSAPQEAPPPFDVGTATADELIAFAFNEYGHQLNPKAPLHVLKNQVIKLANANNQPAADADLG